MDAMICARGIFEQEYSDVMEVNIVEDNDSSDDDSNKSSDDVKEDMEEEDNDDKFDTNCFDAPSAAVGQECDRSVIILFSLLKCCSNCHFCSSQDAYDYQDDSLTSVVIHIYILWFFHPSIMDHCNVNMSLKHVKALFLSESISLVSILFFDFHRGARETCLLGQVKDLGYWYCRYKLEAGKGCEVKAQD
jgi:hypothetical protein